MEAFQTLVSEQACVPAFNTPNSGVFTTPPALNYDMNISQLCQLKLDCKRKTRSPWPTQPHFRPLWQSRTISICDSIVFTLSTPGRVREVSLHLSFSSTCGLTHFCSASILMCIKSILSPTAVCDARLKAGPLGPRCLPYSLVAMATDRAAVHLQPILPNQIGGAIEKTQCIAWHFQTLIGHFSLSDTCHTVETQTSYI